jgi:hypothetical protein
VIVQSGEIADNLGSQLTALKAALSLSTTQKVLESLTTSEASNSANQRSDLTKQLAEAGASYSLRTNYLSEDEKMQATQPLIINPLSETERNVNFLFITRYFN